MAKVSKATAVREVSILKARVGVSFGDEYFELTGASAVDHPAGTRSVEQIATLRGTATSVGAKSIEPVTFDLAAVQPHLPVMRQLAKADSEQSQVSVRIDVYSKELHNVSSQTAVLVLEEADELRKGGAVTFSPKADVEGLFLTDQVLVGDILVLNSKNYIVNYVEIENDPTMAGYGTVADVYVKTATGASIAAGDVVAAAAFSLRTAGLRWQFGAKVEQFGMISADASGSPALTSGVVFRPNSQVAEPTVQIWEEGSTAAGW